MCIDVILDDALQPSYNRHMYRYKLHRRLPEMSVILVSEDTLEMKLQASLYERNGSRFRADRTPLIQHDAIAKRPRIG